MGNEAATEESQPEQENVDNTNKSSTSSTTSDADIKAYFNTKFPVVISQEVFDIRYIYDVYLSNDDV